MSVNVLAKLRKSINQSTTIIAKSQIKTSLIDKNGSPQPSIQRSKSSSFRQSIMISPNSDRLKKKRSQMSNQREQLNQQSKMIRKISERHQPQINENVLQSKSIFITNQAKVSKNQTLKSLSPNKIDNNKSKYSYAVQEKVQDLKDKINRLETQNQQLKRERDQLKIQIVKMASNKRKQQQNLENIVKQFEKTIAKQDQIYARERQSFEIKIRQLESKYIVLQQQNRTCIQAKNNIADQMKILYQSIKPTRISQKYMQGPMNLQNYRNKSCKPQFGYIYSMNTAINQQNLYAEEWLKLVNSQNHRFHPNTVSMNQYFRY